MSTRVLELTFKTVLVRETDELRSGFTGWKKQLLPNLSWRLTPSPTVLSRTCAPRRVRLIVQSSGSSSWSEHEVARFGRARRMAMLAPAALFVETGVGLELLCWDTPTAKRFTVQATGKTTQPSMWDCVEVLKGYRVVVMILQYSACFGTELAVNSRLAVRSRIPPDEGC
jgi:nitrate/nitrite transporter NarK